MIIDKNKGSPDLSLRSVARGEFQHTWAAPADKVGCGGGIARAAEGPPGGEQSLTGADTECKGEPVRTSDVYQSSRQWRVELTGRPTWCPGRGVSLGRPSWPYVPGSLGEGLREKFRL